jgi:hypothetical protein
MTRPLDSVGEDQGADQDHGEADHQQYEGAHRMNLLTGRGDQA